MAKQSSKQDQTGCVKLKLPLTRTYENETNRYPVFLAGGIITDNIMPDTLNQLLQVLPYDLTSSTVQNNVRPAITTNMGT